LDKDKLKKLNFSLHKFKASGEKTSIIWRNGGFWIESCVAQNPFQILTEIE
jgi:hypothetical protein